MTRRKELAKKRKHDQPSSSRRPTHEEEEESSQEEDVHERDVPIAGNRRLQLGAMEMAKVGHLKTKRILGGVYMDMPLLDSYGCREGVERLMSHPQWSSVFGWRGHTYDPLIYEFVASLKTKSERYHKNPSISFTLFNKAYNLSVNELGVYLNLHSEAEQRSAGYLSLLSDFPSNEDLNNYWGSLCNEEVEFEAGKTHARHIVRNDLKVVRLLLAITFNGRISNLHKLYRSDLFALWSMENGERINMGAICKRWLTTQSQDNTTNIFIGPFLARLCEGLGLGNKMRREARIASMTPLPQEELNRANLVRVFDAHEGEALPMPPPPNMPNIPPHYTNVTNWETMRAFQYQLHEEQMAVLARHGQAIDDLREQFARHFHPPSHGGDMP